MMRGTFDRRLGELERAVIALPLVVRAWLGEPLTDAEAIQLAQSDRTMSPQTDNAARAAMTPGLQAWLDERGEPETKEIER